MPKISDPIKIGKVELSNRLAVAPTLENYSTPEGYSTTRYVTYHDRLARGGWGWITVGVHSLERWQSIASQGGSIHSEACVPGLSEVARAIHKWHVPCSVQIMSAGMQSAAYPHLWSGWPGYDPRGLTEGLLYGIFPYKAMSTEQLELEQEKFVVAADRVKRAGFDGVTFHGASGFLIQQLMSPSTNKRTDRYKDRLLWVTEMIRKVRVKVGPDFALIMRGSGHEYTPGGYELDWFAKEACPAMVEAGIDALDITAGSQEAAGIPWVCPPIYQPMGLLMHIPQAIKKEVSVPVIGVGKINDPRMARHYVEEGFCDIVSVCRQALADPDFARKTIVGADDEVRKCMFCDYCGWCNLANWPLLCAINSEQGRPVESHLTMVEKPRKVVVIGGGVGGMEAARVASLRGHDVTLLEKNAQLGGLASTASRMPHVFVRSLNNPVEWLTGQLKKQGVKIQLGEEATAQMVVDMKPDAVIVAAGSRPAIPDIPGVGEAHVFTMDDYLTRKAKLGSKIAVLGGGYGAEIAVSIARGGKEVTLLVEGGPEAVTMAPYLFDYPRNLMLQDYLAETRVNIITGTKHRAISPRGVEYEDKEGKRQTVVADTVILATGRMPNRELADALRGRVAELWDIGDCRRPDKIATAIHDGAHIGRII